MSVPTALKIGGIVVIGFVCYSGMGLMGLLLTCGIAMVVLS